MPLSTSPTAAQSCGFRSAGDPGAGAQVEPAVATLYRALCLRPRRDTHWLVKLPEDARD
ncbi:hypothetical protein ACFWN1_18845 [Streptomyces sp. NPDC058459]|uniref:hypothetical protein n=1 Tax=Streptomyces sp. NPDC058459 TaxID=3346508 RepID=UPI0036531AD2